MKDQGGELKQKNKQTGSLLPDPSPDSAIAFFKLGATVTESSTWPCDDVKPIFQSHGHVEDSVTVAPSSRIQHGDSRDSSDPCEDARGLVGYALQGSHPAGPQI